MEEASEKSFDHAWRYFELHAQQRMTVFNFYLFLIGLVAAGIAASIQAGKNMALLGVFLGLLLAFISFIFWKLDQRVSFLLKFSESVMASLESKLTSEASRLFHNEPIATTAARSTGNFLMRHWTYGRSFRLTFATAGTVGIMAAIFSLFRFMGMTN